MHIDFDSRVVRRSIKIKLKIERNNRELNEYNEAEEI